MLVFLSVLLTKLQKRKRVRLEKCETTKVSKKDIIFKITLSAIFIALATVLKSFSITTGEMRLGFYEVPVFLSGIILGPLFGSLVGLGSDMIYSLSSGYSFSPIMMCSAVMWGFIGSLFYNKKVKLYQTFILCLIASIVATTINSLQLYIYYGMGMFANLPNRIFIMIIKWPIISVVTWVLSERVIKKVIKSITNRKNYS